MIFPVLDRMILREIFESYHRDIHIVPRAKKRDESEGRNDMIRPTSDVIIPGLCCCNARTA